MSRPRPGRSARPPDANALDDSLKWIGGGAVEHCAVHREAGAVTGAVPGLLGVVEVDLAAEMGAAARDRDELPVAPPKAGCLTALGRDDSALAGLQIGK